MFFFFERKTLVAKVEAYILQLLDLLYPLDPNHAEQYFLEYGTLNLLIVKKKGLLDQQTLDSSNIVNLDLMSDSGYDAFSNFFRNVIVIKTLFI